MKPSEISYRILYHTKGYIRLEMPFLKSLSWSVMFNNIKKSLSFPIPAAIKDFHVNTMQGNIIITYEPQDIDILSYLKNMSSDPEINKILRGNYYEMSSPHQMAELCMQGER
jgi:hypothetical protein